MHYKLYHNSRRSSNSWPQCATPELPLFRQRTYPSGSTWISTWLRPSTCAWMPFSASSASRCASATSISGSAWQ